MSWVMFDFGGVVCTPQPEQDLAALAAMAGVSVPELLDAYWPRRLSYDEGALTAVTYWQDVAGRLATTFTQAQIDGLVRLDIASWAHLDEATVRLINDLDAAGIRLALLSNAPVEVARSVADLPVARHFEHLMFSCYFHAVKPDPACFRQALDQLGAAPGEVSFIDDREPNVTAAAGMGMHAHRFTGAGQARDWLAGINAAS